MSLHITKLPSQCTYLCWPVNLDPHIYEYANYPCNFRHLNVNAAYILNMIIQRSPSQFSYFFSKWGATLSKTLFSRKLFCDGNMQ